MNDHRPRDRSTSRAGWPHAPALAGAIVGLALLIGVLNGSRAWSDSENDGPPPLVPEAPMGPPAPPEPSPSRLARKVLETGPVTGVVLGVFSQDPTYDYTELLREIRETGSPWVSLLVNNYQAKNDSARVGVPDRRSPPLDRVRVTIRQARALGLRVLLFPILLLQDAGEDDWRGTIDPTDRDAWFDSYRALLNRYAKLAADENVDLLSIGSEFNSLQRDAAEWSEVIRQVRALYDGPITYSANWDSLEGVSFISQLDLVGMTTYFGLSKENDPSVDTMVATWQAIQSDVHEWKTFHGIPLLFSEVGYPSQDGANQNPWNYYHSSEVDLGEQYDCFDAFTRVWTRDTALSGVFFYNWFGEGGPKDTGYTPRGKPALELIRKWFETHRAKRDPKPAPEKPAAG